MHVTDKIVKLFWKQKHGSKSDTQSCYDVMTCMFFVGVFLLANWYGGHTLSTVDITRATL